MKPPRAPDPRTARTRARILSATSELLAAPGGSGASIAQIAKLAGVSVGSVYIHFENKDELVAQVIQLAWERCRESFAATRESASPLDRVFAFGEALMGFARSEPVAFRALRVRAVDPPSNPASTTERSLLAPHLALLEADLADAMELGEIAAAPTKPLAVVLFSTWSGIAEQLVRRDGLELDGAADRVVQQLARSILAAGLSPAAVAT